MKWRPIETAPKNNILGPNIIVCDAAGRVDVAWWEDGDLGDERGWYSATNHDGYTHAGLAPTHWMPLPEPPGK